MRHAALTLMRVVPPVAASWPIGRMYADIAQWQGDNARHVLEQALKTVGATAADQCSPKYTPKQ